METLYTLLIFFVLVMVLAVPYWVRVARHQREAAERLRKSEKGGILTPVTLHPQIDSSGCIGCGSCVKVCPEDVLGLVEGRVAIVNGLRCVGHGLCADVCPVEAISLGFGTPKEGQEIPLYDDEYQSNVPGLYIVGELGGVGLIRNAVKQSRIAMAALITRHTPHGNDLDVVIVGAGPAGLTAALVCQEQGLRYVVLEQDSIGGTIFHYPRNKLVLTAPVELPLYGTLKASEISKEDLLEVWTGIVEEYGLGIRTGLKVDNVEKGTDGFFVRAGESAWTAANVLLAIGRRGSPRKLGVPGEELPKVAYKLIEAETYRQKNILVVGGGDSAVEAAVGLARQPGNHVTISYRRDQFVRLKEKNEQRVGELIHSGRIEAAFGSTVSEIRSREVVLHFEAGSARQLPNDHVFIFAGGELPTALLKKAGVRLRTGASRTEAA